MSDEHPQHQHGDHVYPDYEVPISQGVPLPLAIALVSFVGVVIMIMGMVIFASPAGHVWPWSEAVKAMLDSK
ncbi:MAG TPA: hypothetical protein VGZ00_09170 [Candidatus Baltobacteraceae bacterium]|nr:hypothetical protein [Candidatus Baltobacteraceae bacterium]